MCTCRREDKTSNFKAAFPHFGTVNILWKWSKLVEGMTTAIINHQHTTTKALRENNSNEEIRNIRNKTAWTNDIILGKHTRTLMVRVICFTYKKKKFISLIIFLQRLLRFITNVEYWYYNHIAYSLNATGFTICKDKKFIIYNLKMDNP